MGTRIAATLLVGGLLTGCLTARPCPPPKIIETTRVVETPAPVPPATPLPDLPIFHLSPDSPREEVSAATVESVLILMNDSLQLRRLLDVYRPKS